MLLVTVVTTTSSDAVTNYLSGSSQLHSLDSKFRHLDPTCPNSSTIPSLYFTAAAMSEDFILTIDSDNEQDSNTPAALAKDVEDLNPDFDFDLTASGFDNDTKSWGGADFVQDVGASGKGAGTSIDDIIARRRTALKKSKQKPTSTDKRAKAEEEDEDDSSNGNDESSEDEEDAESWGGVESENEDEEDESEEEGFGMGVVYEEDPEAADPLASDDEIDLSSQNGNEEAPSDDDDDEAASSDDDNVSIASSASSTTSNPETDAQIARKAAFFSEDPTAPAPNSSKKSSTTFAQMSLSRPLLRNITALGFTNPTPIQNRAIPLALLGRDILGSAETGSGKTAAFMIPVLERLIYRDKGKNGKGSASRVLVLCPTRELAVQCQAVGEALAKGLDVRFALLVGGLSLSAQSALLRTLPDILIATPGRLIDHIRNSQSFTLDALDVLIIDEADRMLEAGFSDELNEIITSCPRSRQTMLFSATMTDSVDELVRLSLEKPVRLFVDSGKKTARSLVQEFVRVRERKRGEELDEEGMAGGNRAAILLALCKRTVKDKCIVFFRSKALAHQMRVLFGLCGLMAGELHGNLTQEQRLQALDDFKNGTVQYLLATDLASRGLDIKGVEVVINYDLPGQLSAYVHRVGRTARAGKKGRSISLVGEADRKMLKLCVKASPADQVRHRVIPTEAIVKMAKRLDELKTEVQEVLKEEKEEKALRMADMEIRKGQNLIEHRDEIMSRPARTWFQSEKEKKAAADASKATYVGGFDNKGKKVAAPEPKEKRKRDKYDGLSRRDKRRKMAIEEDAEYNDGNQIAASIRGVKKALRPVKITEDQPKVASLSKPKKKKPTVGGAGGGGKKIKIGKGAFDTEFGKKGEAARTEGARAGRYDGVGLGGKKGKGGGTKGKGGPKGGKGKGGKR
ncbi:dead-domain-containing protein [Phaffia rhodozyma]|uniref:RNA helicase n=1 Tax=Phaffia rhodozyma TaxID=264483 RepID=A0A0F7SUQ9_PHARH|nr:dead-domain-containing protein [Phaffia rhodozyma]